MFEYLIDEHICEWNEEFLHIPNPDLTHKYFLFLREAILDAHIPVQKVIGYQTYTANDRHGNPHVKMKLPFRETELGKKISITRDVNIAESHITLNNRAKHYIFNLPYGTEAILTDKYIIGPIHLKSDFKISTVHTDFLEYSCDVTSPSVTAEHVLIADSDMTFKMSKDVDPWFEPDVFCTATGCVPAPWIIRLKLREDTGYISVAEMQKYTENLSKQRPYWTFAQSFDLNEFVQILPKFDNPNCIFYKLNHGMTASFLHERIANYVERLNAGTLKEEDAEWAYRFK